MLAYQGSLHLDLSIPFGSCVAGSVPLARGNTSVNSRLRVFQRGARELAGRLRDGFCIIERFGNRIPRDPGRQKGYGTRNREIELKREEGEELFGS